MTTTALLPLLLMWSCGDNNVQWNGISHVGWQDRRPLAPVNREAFSVYLQTYKLDVCQVRVRFEDPNGVGQWISAPWDHDRGPYAVWKADLPASSTDVVRYYFEITDGSDVDYYGTTGVSDAAPAVGNYFTLNFASLEHAPLGATPATGGTVFRVWAPTATQAYVRGAFNNWGTTNPMLKTGEYFAAFVSGAAARQKYKYFFNPGGIWKTDARARAMDGGDGYNGIIENPLSYSWVVNDFPTPAKDDLILYELHVGTFAGRNDPVPGAAIPSRYRDVAARVGHLVDLGINAVELMPITEFPGDYSAGYNPVTAWAPELKLGQYNDFKYMVDVLHQNGIAVFLDIVWNHVSPTDNYLWNYDGGQIYFDSPNAVQTPWGSQADFDRNPVRDYYQNSAFFWLEEMKLDGFRFDGSEFMNQPPQEASGWSLMQWHNDALDNRWIDKVSTVEQLPDDFYITRPTSLGGAGFDATWHDQWVDTLRQAIFDAAFGNPNMAALAAAINGSTGLQGSSVVHYLESHDEIWPSTGGTRIINVIDTTSPVDDMWAKGRSKLGQGLTLVAPGIPMIFMGTEWLENTNFLGGDPNGRIDWSKKTTYANIFKFYKDTIRIRKTNGALKAGSPWNVYHVNDTSNVLALHRWDLAGNDIIVVVNFSNTNYASYNLGFPQGGAWYELLNSQSAKYDGNGQDNGGVVATTGGPLHGFNQSASIVLPQMGLAVFRYNDPPCPGDADYSGAVDQDDLDQVLFNFGTSQPAGRNGDVDGDGDVDQDDLDLVLFYFGASC